MASTLSNMLIGLVLITVFAVGFSLFMADGIGSYNVSVPSGYNESLVRIASVSASIQNNSEAAKASLSGASQTGFIQKIVDIVGFLINTGVDSAALLINSLDNARIVASEGISSIPGLNGFGGILVTASSAIIIVIIVTLIMAFFIKSGRE